MHNMLTTHLPLIFVLLGSVTAFPQFIDIICLDFRIYPDLPRVADCLAAIEMLPSGRYEFDGTKPYKPLHILLPQKARERKFYIPAIFRSGNCQVQVAPLGSRRYDKPSPTVLEKPASAMYTAFWPAVRANATKMVDRCLRQGNKRDGAILNSRVMLEQFRFAYDVHIMDVDPEMPGDGWVVDLNGPWWYNVYEPGGSASGHCTKGHWQNYSDPSWPSFNSSSESEQGALLSILGVCFMRPV